MNRFYLKSRSHVNLELFLVIFQNWLLILVSPYFRWAPFSSDCWFWWAPTSGEPGEPLFPVSPFFPLTADFGEPLFPVSPFFPLTADFGEPLFPVSPFFPLTADFGEPLFLVSPRGSCPNNNNNNNNNNNPDKLGLPKCLFQYIKALPQIFQVSS